MWQASAYAPAIVTKRLPQIWQVKSCNRFTHSPTAVLRTVRVTVNWRLSGVSFPLGAPTFARLSPGISSGNGSKSELGNLSILNRQILKPSRPRSSQYLAMQAASETGDDSASPRISNSRFAAQLSEPPRGRSSAICLGITIKAIRNGKSIPCRSLRLVGNLHDSQDPFVPTREDQICKLRCSIAPPRVWQTRRK